MEKKSNQIILFGSKHCPGCVDVKAYLDKKNYVYEYIDITDSMPNLKAFLKIRDTSDVYRGIRGRAIVGIPMIKSGDEIIIALEEDKLDEIFNNK